MSHQNLCRAQIRAAAHQLGAVPVAQPVRGPAGNTGTVHGLSDTVRHAAAPDGLPWPPAVPREPPTATRHAARRFHEQRVQRQLRGDIALTGDTKGAGVGIDVLAADLGDFVDPQARERREQES